MIFPIENTLARTKSHEGLTVYHAFDHVGKVWDRAFNRYHKSLWEAQQAVVRHPWVLVTIFHDLNPDLSVYLWRTVT